MEQHEQDEVLFLLAVRAAMQVGLTRGRDLIIDSAPFAPGAVPTPMRPMAIPRPTTAPATGSATGSTPGCAAGRACPWAVWSRQPMRTMPRSPSPCCGGPVGCSRCAHAWSGSTPPTGASLSSTGVAE